MTLIRFFSTGIFWVCLPLKRIWLETKLIFFSWLKCVGLSHIAFPFFQSLLDEPNPNSPANSQAAQLYQENKREYEKRVSAIVEQSWNDS